MQQILARTSDLNEYKMPNPEQLKLSDKLRRHSRNLHDRME